MVQRHRFKSTKEGRTKAGKEKKKKADDSHHPEAKQTGYNQTQIRKQSSKMSFESFLVTFGPILGAE